jgi:hypothetical protein
VVVLYSFALHIRRGTYKRIAMIRDLSHISQPRRAMPYSHVSQDSRALDASDMELDITTPSKPTLRLDPYRKAMPVPEIHEEPFTPTTAPGADPSIQPYGGSSMATAMMRSRSTDESMAHQSPV